jgi:hypothetical protein
MTCDALRGDLDAFLDGGLDPERAGAVRAHLDACPDCRLAVEEARAFSGTLREGIRRHVGAIVPPPGAKEVLRLRLAAATRLPAWPRRLAWAAAAAVLVGLAAWAGFGIGRNGVGAGALVSRYAELEAIRAWQDELVDVVGRPSADPALGIVACAYLPPERGRALLRSRLGGEPTETALCDAWTAEVVPLVRLERSTNGPERSTSLLFIQTSDGRVRVEHTERANGDTTVTKLEAASWEILALQNPVLCRKLEIVDGEGRLLAGLPIPAEPLLRREAAGVIARGTSPKGLARKLLALRLAPRVRSAEEMERELESVAAPVVAEGRPAVPPDRLADAVRRLERETGADRIPVKELADAMACFQKMQGL